MGSGDRNNLFWVEEENRDKDQQTESGEFPGKYLPAFQWYASMEPLRGLEKFQAEQVQSTVTHKLEGAYDSQFDQNTSRRLRLGTRIFNINSIIDVGERHTDIEIMATEDQDAARKEE